MAFLYYILVLSSPPPFLRWVVIHSVGSAHVPTSSPSLRPHHFHAGCGSRQVIFWIVQLLYTIMTFLPVKFSYDHQWFCITVMWLCFCTCVWNGANYYIEVFSTRYTMKFNPNGHHVPEQGGASARSESPSSGPEQPPGRQSPALPRVLYSYGWLGQSEAFQICELWTKSTFHVTTMRDMGFIAGQSVKVTPLVQ